MANDLAAMKSRIASEIARSDLTTQIANAINDAINAYQKERFRFSESVPSVPETFTTVTDQWIYGVAANANIPTLLKVDYITYVIENTVWKLDREMPINIRLWNQVTTMKGMPSWFAVEGEEIMLSPVPDRAYVMTIGAFFLVAAPATDVEADNPWMTTAERLIRARAKYELAVHVTRNPAMAEAMSPDAPPPGQRGGAAYRAWKELKGDANRYTGRGIIRPMAF